MFNAIKIKILWFWIKSFWLFWIIIIKVALLSIILSILSSTLNWLSRIAGIVIHTRISPMRPCFARFWYKNYARPYKLKKAQTNKTKSSSLKCTPQFIALLHPFSNVVECFNKCIEYQTAVLATNDIIAHVWCGYIYKACVVDVATVQFVFNLKFEKLNFVKLKNEWECAARQSVAVPQGLPVVENDIQVY